MHAASPLSETVGQNGHIGAVRPSVHPTEVPAGRLISLSGMRRNGSAYCERDRVYMLALWSVAQVVHVQDRA